MAQKKQKKRELGENGENSGENKPLFPPAFQTLSKYCWRELLHLSFAVDPKTQRGVSDDYRKILHGVVSFKCSR